MILTDREIQAAIQSKQIMIDPAPAADAYSSTSVDLTLDSLYHKWKNVAVVGVEPPVISPGTPGFSFMKVRDAHMTRFEMDGEGVILEPKDFVLTWTKERLTLPVNSKVAARVEGKSSLARCGVSVHITAPTIHSGFDGPLQLEMYNHSTLRVKLIPKMKVCTLIFEMCLGTPSKGYAGMFTDQRA